MFVEQNPLASESREINQQLMSVYGVYCETLSIRMYMLASRADGESSKTPPTKVNCTVQCTPLLFVYV